MLIFVEIVTDASGIAHLATGSSLDLISVPDTTIMDLPNKPLERVFVFNSLHNFQHIYNPVQTIHRTSQVDRWRVLALNNSYTMGSHCWSWTSRWRSPPSYNQKSRGQKLATDNASQVPLVWDDRSSRHCARAQSMALTLVSLRPGTCWRIPSQKRSILLSVSSNWLVFLCPIMIDYLPPTPFVDDIRERIWPFWRLPWNSHSSNLRECNFLFTAYLFLSLWNGQHIFPAPQVLPPLAYFGRLKRRPLSHGITFEDCRAMSKRGN